MTMLPWVGGEGGIWSTGVRQRLRRGVWAGWLRDGGLVNVFFLLSVLSLAFYIRSFFVIFIVYAFYLSLSFALIFFLSLVALFSLLVFHLSLSPFLTFTFITFFFNLTIIHKRSRCTLMLNFFFASQRTERGPMYSYRRRYFQSSQ